MKKLLATIIIGLVLTSTVCFADDDIAVTVDGQKLEFDSQPTIVDGRTLVPIRKIFETFGYTVDWDGTASTVKASKADKTITLQVDSTTASVDSKDVTLDVPPENINDRVLVPLRFIAEASDAKVNWDGDKKLVTITTGDFVYTSSQTTLDALKLDDTKWNFDATNNVYWQIGVQYCAAPEATDYETMGIYVPAQYMTGKDNGDGTYTCTVNASGTVGTYTSATAPMVIPVETPGYAAHKAPTSFNYDSVSSYLKAGFIYLDAGCRGRLNMMSKDDSETASTTTAQISAPWGVADLKAAIRYIRLNSSAVPGDSAKIFSFGMSGGGAQSALLGSSGDNSMYYPYLDKINAAFNDADGNKISDALCGSMCWCPVTSLDIGDEAYEWMMGQYATADTRAAGTFTAALSSDLANAFGEYINNAGFKDAKGNSLTLTKSTDGIYTSGTYYDYIKSVIETSLNNFLADTTFPYTPAADRGGQFGGFVAGQGFGGGTPPTGTPTGDPNGTPAADAAQNNNTSSRSSVTYATAKDYIDSLNASAKWIDYDEKTNTATITDIAAFAQNCKKATKSVSAFDTLDKSAPENTVFGNSSNDPAHFDVILASLLQNNKDKYAAYSDWKDSYVTDYQEYKTVIDELGTSSTERQNMYEPLYYVNSSSASFGTSTVAPYWRIRTGIFQCDTSLTTEADLALALGQCSSVKDVDFATVWGQYHTTAERTGNSTDNFVAWVNQCCAAK